MLDLVDPVDADLLGLSCFCLVFIALGCVQMCILFARLAAGSCCLSLG